MAAIKEAALADATETVTKAPAKPAAKAEAAPAPKKIGPASGDVWATGRRKSSVARVRIRRGDGKFQVNRKSTPTTSLSSRTA